MNYKIFRSQMGTEKNETLIEEGECDNSGYVKLKCIALSLSDIFLYTYTIDNIEETDNIDSIIIED